MTLVREQRAHNTL